MISKAHIFLILFAHVCGDTIFEKCPARCRCELDQFRKKTASCVKGGMTTIPTQHLDVDIQRLIIFSPPNNPNYLTLGRIFLEFRNLEEIVITHSNIPAIGESSFWPGKKVKLLDLSHNNISILFDLDFNGLRNLEILNLSDNSLVETPSAPFRLLSNLETLILARNKLTTLVPRLFYLLNKLKHLDLSHNPLKTLQPENIKDIKPLKILNVAYCEITRLHSRIYQLLPNLEELDLRGNLFRIFAPEEFRHMRKLSILHLDYNNLSLVVEKTFDGHNLKHLGLSNNQISTFAPCAFCNASIEELDLSNNCLLEIVDSLFTPIVHSLVALDLSSNIIPYPLLNTAIKPLYKLERLSISRMKLRVVDPNTFITNTHLKFLNLSYNGLINITRSTIEPLNQLIYLDLSHNRFESLDWLFLKRLDNITSLDYLKLNSNPWSCQVCQIADMYNWVKSTHLFGGECDFLESASGCVTCVTPAYLEGKRLSALQLEDLALCYNADYQRNFLTTTTTHTGAIVAILIIIVFISIIVVIVLVYRRQGAEYYTGEERSTSRDRSNSKGCTYISTLDKIDEVIDEKPDSRT